MELLPIVRRHPKVLLQLILSTWSINIFAALFIENHIQKVSQDLVLCLYKVSSVTCQTWATSILPNL